MAGRWWGRLVDEIRVQLDEWRDAIGAIPVPGPILVPVPVRPKRPSR